jgi:hypothetical protein
MANAVLPIAVGPAIMINVLLISNPVSEFNIHPFGYHQNHNHHYLKIHP